LLLITHGHEVFLSGFILLSFFFGEAKIVQNENKSKKVNKKERVWARVNIFTNFAA